MVDTQFSPAGAAPVPAPRAALTLGDTLAWPARYLPRKEALVVSDAQGRRAWTYAELDAEVNRHAHGLQQLGIGQGDVVAAFLYNTPAFVFTLLATARLGAIFNPINYRLAAQELAFILQDGSAKALVFEDEGAAVVEKARLLVPQVQHWIHADPGAAPAFATAQLAALADGQPATPVDVRVDEDAPCILMYTSGTTGRPKGVLHTHRSKLAHNAMMHQVMQFRREDVGLSVAPLNHTAELHTSFLPRLQVGATQVLQRRFDAADALRLVEAEKSHLLLCRADHGHHAAERREPGAARSVVAAPGGVRRGLDGAAPDPRMDAPGGIGPGAGLRHHRNGAVHVGAVSA
ncbi:hypothetical protein CT3_23590 [Comamonas terrigena NBRC 13299]|nr:hypothetical protein CT3_23590 [Comamonas terrigena NBRC 13299]